MTAESTSRSERTTDPMEKLRQHHIMAIVGSEFEHYLNTAEEPSWTGFVEQANLPVLPERYITTLQRLVERHAEQTAATAQAERILVDNGIISPPASVDQEDISDGPPQPDGTPFGRPFVPEVPKSDGERNGKSLFRARTNRDPVGTVYFENAGTHFLLCFSDERDDTSFNDSYEHESVEGSFSPKYNLHLRDRYNYSRSDSDSYSEYDYEYLDETRVSQSDFTIQDLGVDTPLDLTIQLIRVYNVAITSREQLMEIKSKTYIHERQHEINHEFQMQGVVDEILARVRDGSNGYGIVRSVNTEYPELFDKMDPDEAQTAKALVTEFGEAFEELGAQLYYKEARAVLVNHFLSATLEQLPRRARALATFYETLLDGVLPSGRTIGRELSTNDLMNVAGTVYPRAISEPFSAANQAEDDALAAYGDTHKRITINRVCNRVPSDDTELLTLLGDQHSVIYNAHEQLLTAYNNPDRAQAPFGEYIEDAREQDFVFDIVDFLYQLDPEIRSEFCATIVKITEDISELTAETEHYSGSEETAHLFLEASDRERTKRDELEVVSPRIQEIRSQLAKMVLEHGGELIAIHFQIDNQTDENQVECLVYYKLNGKFQDLKAWIPIVE